MDNFGDDPEDGVIVKVTFKFRNERSLTVTIKSFMKKFCKDPLNFLSLPSKVISSLNLDFNKNKFNCLGGEFHFCFQTTTSHWFVENKYIRFSFRLVSQDGIQTDYKELAHKEHLSNL